MADLDPHDNFIHDRYGYCYYSIEPGQHPIVYNLYTEPEYRRQGHARKHIQYVISEIRCSGYTGIIDIEVAPYEDSISRADITAFYQSLGLHTLEVLENS